MTNRTQIASGDDGSAMRAIVVEAFGDAAVLGLREWPRPQARAGQVLIEVRCAGVNFADVMSRRSGYLGVTPPFVPGLEVAGVVRDVAAGVTAFSPGDRVCAMTPGGGYAELAVADVHTVFAVPAGVDWPVAAALPTVVPTAYALLHEVGASAPASGSSSTRPPAAWAWSSARWPEPSGCTPRAWSRRPARPRSRAATASTRC